MKSIQLTEEQKEKLLEMCKELFPEYNNIKIKCTLKGKKITVSKRIYFDGSGNMMGFPKKEMADVDPYITYDWIHWFEFCMTHLQDKLKGLGGFENDFDCDVNLMSCWYESHPVDYLYSEFKKLK